MKSCLRQTLPPDAYMGPGASTQPLNSFVTSDFTGRHRSIIADAALYRHGSIEKARTQLRRSSTLPQLKVPPNTRRKSRKGLHTLRLLTPINAATSYAALHGTEVHDPRHPPHGCPYADAATSSTQRQRQEFARSVPAITHPCVVVTLRARGSHMKFCCPLAPASRCSPHRNRPNAAPKQYSDGESTLTAGIERTTLLNTNGMLDGAASTPALPLPWCRSKRKWTRQSDSVIHNPAPPPAIQHTALTAVA
jgi:hypothetical protein